MPWKNGGGITTELLIEPADATLESFDWRLSMARLDADGPFSSFPGIDRVLAMLEGTVTLTIDGVRHTLGPDDAPVRFGGESAVHAALPTKSSATDLNLMVRRERFKADLTRHVVAERSEWRPPSHAAALFLKSGRARVEDGTLIETLGAHDVLVLPSDGRSLLLLTDTRVELYCIEVES